MFKPIFPLTRLVPCSGARVFPEHIPKALLDNYKEACLVRDLSPKASATLSRRCLQGMIRDFWGITRKTLHKEIEALEEKIGDGLDRETWEAIDIVRKLGNIGAHMEEDVNVIVDVDPGEAGVLIELIETLFKDWYVSRREREDRFKRLKEIMAEKEAERLKPPGIDSGPPTS